jgi:hypothetical protein
MSWCLKNVSIATLDRLDPTVHLRQLEKPMEKTGGIQSGKSIKFMEIVFGVASRGGEFLRQAPRHDDAGDVTCASEYLLDLLDQSDWRSRHDSNMRPTV